MANNIALILYAPSPNMKQNMVRHAFHSSIQEAEAGRSLTRSYLKKNLPGGGGARF